MFLSNALENALEGQEAALYHDGYILTTNDGKAFYGPFGAICKHLGMTDDIIAVLDTLRNPEIVLAAFLAKHDIVVSTESIRLTQRYAHMVARNYRDVVRYIKTHVEHVPVRKEKNHE